MNCVDWMRLSLYLCPLMGHRRITRFFLSIDPEFFFCMAVLAWLRLSHIPTNLELSHRQRRPVTPSRSQHNVTRTQIAGFEALSYSP